MSKQSLSKAVEIVGGQLSLAKAIRHRIPGCKVTQAFVWKWLNSKSDKDQVPPAEYCRAIEAATGGKITRYDLRPDVFGESPQTLQTEEAA